MTVMGSTALGILRPDTIGRTLSYVSPKVPGEKNASLFVRSMKLSSQYQNFEGCVCALKYIFFLGMSLPDLFYTLWFS